MHKAYRTGSYSNAARRTVNYILLEDAAATGGAGRQVVLDIVMRDVVVIVSELLEGLSLGLLDEQGGKDAAEHEKSVYLQDVVEPRAGVGGSRAAGAEGGDSTLACFCWKSVVSEVFLFFFSLFFLLFLFSPFIFLDLSVYSRWLREGL